ncbi:MAG TPA: hypothetical protein PKI76_04295 [Oscillospiraceae bacterium]|nr:hypothetical protein [Oscillospiraceae bacterium]HNW04585.1 hypothetical protein [Oscillospiraceae bacterium]
MKRFLSIITVCAVLLALSGCDASDLAEKGEEWRQQAESSWTSFEERLTGYGYKPSDEVREEFRAAADETADSAKAYLQGEGSFVKATAELIGEAGKAAKGLGAEIRAAKEENPGDREKFSEAVDAILLDRIEAYKKAVAEAYAAQG